MRAITTIMIIGVESLRHTLPVSVTLNMPTLSRKGVFDLNQN